MSDQTPNEPDEANLPNGAPESDRESTEEQTEVQPQADARREGGGPRRLLRSRRDRVWAGVAGGLGEYFSVDPVIIRIAFAASVFIGGIGAFAYLAMALFVPMDQAPGGEEEGHPADRPRWLAWAVGAAAIVFALSWGVWDHRPFHGPLFIGPPLLILALVAGAIWIARGSDRRRISGPGGVLLRLLIAAAIFGALCVAALVSAWAGATGHGVVIAVAIVVIGLGLIATARRGSARWLIVPAIALAAPLGIVSASNIRFNDSIGARDYTPSTLADVPADGYQLGVGRIAIDLRDVQWKRGDVLPLDVDLGVGELVVAVPHDVCVSSDLDADAGQVRVPGENSNGVEASYNGNGSSNATPRLDLHAHVDAGDIQVVNDDDISIRHRIGDDGSAEDLRAACNAPAGGDKEPTKPARPKEPTKPATAKDPSGN